MATRDIPIKYVNNSGSTDFKVVVFTKNFSQSSGPTHYTAWQVLHAQSVVEFMYPAEVSVGALYKTKGQTIMAGPFPAKPGSTWSVEMDSPSSSAILTEDSSKPKNRNGTIVIRNSPPSSNSWGGRKLDLGIFKNNRLLLTHPDVHVGDQVDFVLQPKLCFGIVANMQVGETFISAELPLTLETFDLSEFPNGIVVTVDEAPDSGQYSFTAESLI